MRYDGALDASMGDGSWAPAPLSPTWTLSVTAVYLSAIVCTDSFALLPGLNLCVQPQADSAWADEHVCGGRREGSPCVQLTASCERMRGGRREHQYPCLASRFQLVLFALFSFLRIFCILFAVLFHFCFSFPFLLFPGWGI